MRTTRWSPDTCGCVLEYDWDDAVADDQRTHTYARHVIICVIHAAVSGGSNRYDAVIEENASRMKVLDYIQANFPVLATRIANQGIESIIGFSPDIRRKGRALRIAGALLTAPQRTALANALANVGTAAVDVTP